MDGLGIPFERRRWGLGNTVIELCTRDAVTVAFLLFAGEILCKAKTTKSRVSREKTGAGFSV